MIECEGIYLDHRIAILAGVNKDLLNIPEVLLPLTKNAARDLNLTVVSEHVHQFQPQGLSLVLILAESHWAAHTWPEHGVMHVDVATCSQTASLLRLPEVLRERFQPKIIYSEPFELKTLPDDLKKIVRLPTHRDNLR